ncbi:GNAT family N-acetyltransferase [Streptomyces sp. NPDC127098]|uniref:GNAT family N-acetyltransferase n=1 Tax=Streptomyces sp. NPDC127098 TaxID=3347137 RepID=UPI003664649A
MHSTLTDYWPLAGLRVTTPRLELRLPTTDELVQLAELACEGVHPPEEMPFLFPWTDLPPPERGRSVIQYHWRMVGQWVPENWALELAVLHEGRPVGVQAIAAKNYATLRQVESGSWLGRAHQGKGIGTEMRQAVVHLAFAGLDATDVVSGALSHNATSQAVSRKVGYRPDGIARHVVRDVAVTEHRYRLTRDEWAAGAAERPPVTVTGLEPCRPLFGL